MVACVIEGASASLAQPDSSATRARRATAGRIGRRARRTARVRAIGASRIAAASGLQSDERRTAAPTAARTRPPAMRRRSRRRIRHHIGEERAHQAVDQRPPVGLFDMVAGVIDQMHVVHAGRAGRHAGEARQAAIDVLDHLGASPAVMLQHLLDQVDAPARRIELVAEQHVGRAGGRAEAAVHASAQDLFRRPRCPDRQAGRG